MAEVRYKSDIEIYNADTFTSAECPNYREAARFLSSQSDKLTWFISRLISPALQVELQKFQNGPDVVTLRSEDWQLQVPRRSKRVKQGIRVMAHNNNIDAIVAHVDTDKFIDRGELLVIPGKNYTTLQMHVDPAHLQARDRSPDHWRIDDRLEGVMAGGFVRGSIFVESLLDGDINPPFANRSDPYRLKGNQYRYIPGDPHILPPSGNN